MVEEIKAFSNHLATLSRFEDRTKAGDKAKGNEVIAFHASIHSEIDKLRFLQRTFKLPGNSDSEALNKTSLIWAKTHVENLKNKVQGYQGDSKVQNKYSRLITNLENELKKMSAKDAPSSDAAEMLDRIEHFPANKNIRNKAKQTKDRGNLFVTVGGGLLGLAGGIAGLSMGLFMFVGPYALPGVLLAVVVTIPGAILFGIGEMILRSLPDELQPHPNAEHVDAEDAVKSDLKGTGKDKFHTYLTEVYQDAEIPLPTQEKLEQITDYYRESEGKLRAFLDHVNWRTEVLKQDSNNAELKKLAAKTFTEMIEDEVENTMLDNGLIHQQVLNLVGFISKYVPFLSSEASEKKQPG